MVFNMIAASVCGHDVATTIAPFHCENDGNGALLALQSQHSENAIYNQPVKDAENILKKGLGHTLSTLSQHMGLHRKAFITLTEYAKHIPVEILNDWA